VIDESQLSDSKVAILSNVKIKNRKTGREITYKLVSESEADPKQARISVTSPIGHGLLGKVVGDIAVIQTPAGPTEFEVLHISLGDN
jgi:transcription elongation factor GreA